MELYRYSRFKMFRFTSLYVHSNGRSASSRISKMFCNQIVCLKLPSKAPIEYPRKLNLVYNTYDAMGFLEFCLPYVYIVVD